MINTFSIRNGWHGRLASTIVVVAVLTVSGCGSAQSPASDRASTSDAGAEEVQVVGSDAGAVDTDRDFEFNLIEHEAVPDSFPSDVPLVDGEFGAAGESQDDGPMAWSVSFEVAADVETTIADIDTAMSDAGFAVITTSSKDGFEFRELESASYWVQLAVTAQADGAFVSYKVVTK